MQFTSSHIIYELIQFKTKYQTYLETQRSIPIMVESVEHIMSVGAGVQNGRKSFIETSIIFGKLFRSNIRKYLDVHSFLFFLNNVKPSKRYLYFRYLLILTSNIQHVLFQSGFMIMVSYFIYFFKVSLCIVQALQIVKYINSTTSL